MREVALSLTPGLEVVTCGSYRRGKPDCGDVDILISHPDGRSHRGLFTNLVQKCTEIGIYSVGVYGGCVWWVCVCVCVRDVRQMVDLLPVGRHWKEQEVHFHRCYSNC